MVRFASVFILTASIAGVTACALDPGTEPSLSSTEQGSTTGATHVSDPPIDPGLPPGTTVVPLPRFEHQPRTVAIPNQVGFLRGEILGQGNEAIVIINGGPGLSSAFVTRLHQGMARSLPGRRIVRYDQRGLGGSTPTTADQNTITGAVADVESIRRFLGVTKIHLVGQSFGGFVAGAYASTHPQNIASIAFIDPLPPLPADSPFTTQGFEAINAYYAGLLAQGILQPGSDDDPPGVAWNRIIGVYFANPLIVPVEITSPTEMSVPAIADAVTADYQANGAPLVANLDRVRIPVLVIGGGVSGFGPTFAQGAAAALAGSHPKVVIIPGAAHITWFDKPAETFGALRTFFDEAAPRN